MSHSERTDYDSSQTFRRPRDGRMLAGVSGALASRFGIDISTVRIAFVVLTICGGAGIPLYVALWLLIAEEGAQHSIAENLTHSLRWG